MSKPGNILYQSTGRRIARTINCAIGFHSSYGVPKDDGNVYYVCNNCGKLLEIVKGVKIERPSVYVAPTPQVFPPHKLS